MKVTPKELWNAVSDLEKRRAELDEALNALRAGYRTGPEKLVQVNYNRADQAYDDAQIALWNLLEAGTAAMVHGCAYVKGPNMRISRHRLIPATSGNIIDPDDGTWGEDA